MEPGRNDLLAEVRGAAAHGTGLWRAARYLGGRTAALLASVVLAVYLTIYVVNLGGFLDQVISAEISLGVAMRVKGGWLRELSAEERSARVEVTVAALEEAAGLSEPLAARSARWLWRALTLQWGESRLASVRVNGRMTQQVHDLVLNALPKTLLLFGLANLGVFLAGIGLALPLSRNQGRWVDRAIAVLSPLSAGPPWIYGILLTVVVFQVPALRSLTSYLTTWPDRFSWPHLLLILQTMCLPVLSVIASKLLQSVNQWRSYFTLYRSEDYVQTAEALGLGRGRVERRFVLLPALPAVLTHLALLLTALWQEVIVLEYFFRVAGVGQLLIRGLRAHDVPTILGLVVLFAYLLALTLLALEVAIALVDPRVRLGNKQGEGGGRPRRHLRARAAGPLRDGFRRPRVRPGTLRVALGRAWAQLCTRASRIREALGSLGRQPGAAVGLVGIVLLAMLAVYTVVTIPYGEAVRRWRGVQQEDYARPENALPVWLDWFNRERMSRTIRLDSRLGQVGRTEVGGSGTSREVVLTFPVEIAYDRFPQDVSVYYYPSAVKPPYVSLVWRKPDGEEVPLKSESVRAAAAYRVSQDEGLRRRLGVTHPAQAIFTPEDGGEDLLRGEYTLELTATLFAPEDRLDAEVIVYGEVFGGAGTDARRRDLMVAVLWGTPVALAFGILAAVGSTLASALIAAAATWYGGVLDALVRRISEINMVLPTLAVSLMVFTLYSKSFWVILGVTVALSIFGTGMRTYRAALQPVVGAPWVEAACVQGASGSRVIWRYLLPHLAPIMVPQMVILVPSYVFLEAALAFLGMSDPSLPTWGGLVQQAFAGDVYGGTYHLVLVPAILMLLLALSFGLLGRSLEQVLNPRLRTR